MTHAAHTGRHTTRGWNWWRRGALENSGYVFYLAAMLQGATGFWIAKIAQDWLLLRITGDITAVGLAASLQFLPILVFGLYGGVLADRFNVRYLVIIGQLGQVVASGTLAVLAITGQIHPWHIFAAATLTGFVQVVEQPARASMIAQLSGRHISQALSLNSIAFQSAGFWGPALSAALVAGVGPGWAFACNALGCTITSILLWRSPTATPQRGEVRQVTLRQGLSSMRATTEIGWTMVLAALLALLTLNLPLIYADMANRQFATGVEGYSLFNSVAAAGCIVGSLVAARVASKPRLRQLTGLLLTLSVLLTIAAFSPTSSIFVVMVGVLSAVGITFQLLANSLVQLAVDPVARGRVMGLYTLIVFGGMSAAGPVVGAIVQRIGGRWTLILLGCSLLGLTVITAIIIGRFAGQSLGVTRKGLTIKEPEVPRHIRKAEDALSTSEKTRQAANETSDRVDRTLAHLADLAERSRTERD